MFSQLWNVSELHVSGTDFVRKASTDETYKVSALNLSIFLENLYGVVYELLLCVSYFKRIYVDIVCQSHLSHNVSFITHSINRNFRSELG